jgi:hypothetical protein
MLNFKCYSFRYGGALKGREGGVLGDGGEGQGAVGAAAGDEGERPCEAGGRERGAGG